MAEPSESRETTPGLTVGEARQKLDTLQGFRNEPGINAVGIGLCKNGPTVILTVNDKEAFERYTASTAQTKLVGLPVHLEIDRIHGSSSDTGSAMSTRPRPLPARHDGIWARLARSLRGFSTLFVP